MAFMHVLEREPLLAQPSSGRPFAFLGGNRDAPIARR
jgi:hypothetical protein